MSITIILMLFQLLKYLTLTYYLIMTKNTDSSTLCSLFWNHQIIDGTGRVKPCCRFSEGDRLKENNLNIKSMTEIFYSDFMSEMRRKSFEGEKISGCKRCYEEEEGGKKSLRQRMNTHPTIGLKTVKFDTPKITNIELAISNDCNLMCRMCDSRFSHKLFNEEVEFLGTPINPTKHTKTNIDFVYEILPDLQFIKFTGGEPLTIKAHWELLEYAVDKGYSKNIRLNYSTNCTVYPKDKFVNIWKEFKFVELAASFDSVIAKENEYQRHLTNQDDVLKNFSKYIELQNQINLEVIGRPTITVLNIFHAPETIEWLEGHNIKVNPTHVTYPTHLSITMLPHHIKTMIKDKFESYDYKTESNKVSSMYLLSYMFSEDNSNLLDKFIEHTKFLDSKRNQNFKEVYPYFNFI